MLGLATCRASEARVRRQRVEEGRGARAGCRGRLGRVLVGPGWPGLMVHARCSTVVGLQCTGDCGQLRGGQEQGVKLGRF